MQEYIDPNAVDVLLAGTVGTLAVLAGSIAAVTVGRHTSVLPARSGKRANSVLAERPSLIVEAQNKMTEDLILRFTFTNPAITLFRIELANQLDKTAGTVECVKANPQIFVAAAEPKVVQRWYNANQYWNGETKQLPIRVFMGDGGHAACRTIWVMMSPGAPPGSGPTDVENSTWLLDGPC
jgi:hypothetical protein